LFPPEGATGETDLDTPFQELGARGVNNLASKLLLALFPPNTPFFELTVDDFALEELAANTDSEDARAEFDAALAKMARTVSDRIDKASIRNKIFEGLKNLLVGGNVLMEVLPSDKVRMHPLDNYVCKRDGEGTPVEIILLQTLTRQTVPERVKELLDPPSDSDAGDEAVALYTWIRRDGKMWKVHQEVGEDARMVPKSEGTYPLDESAFVPLRLIEVDGEDYGRSYVEEYLGGLTSLERNTKSIVEFSSEAARIVYGVDDGGLTDADEFAEASTGDVIDGNMEKDVTTHRLDKAADFQITDAVSIRMEKRLEHVFLLMSSIQRDGERVTAEEIRRLASEIEEALGGVYSLLAGELQEPLARRLMKQMADRKELPRLPDDSVDLKVVTGVAALGRNHDLLALDEFVSGVLQVAGPEAVADYINLEGYFKRRAAALNISVDGMIRSDKEVQQMQQQRQMAEALKQSGPAAVGYLDNRAAEAAQQQPQE
jgi:hypothetical protein